MENVLQLNLNYNNNEELTLKTNFMTGTMHNIQVVLGRRWYLTWILPLIQSTLPYDGMDWKNTVAPPLKNTKSK